ncbi:MAG: sigma-54-dependent Fis family transcriptional regulator [Sedimentisphaerales bacterium]|nr:sigma-54-dependent Fis family transcriptional regulator [Sedimentisphaerales bacterium]
MLDYRVRKLAAIFTADSFYRHAISESLETLAEVAPREISRWSDLNGLLDEKSVCLAVFALSDEGRRCIGSSSEEFNKFIQFLPRLRNHHPLCQVILIPAHNLSVQHNCEAIVQGVTAIVDPHQDNFSDDLREHLHEAYHHFQELQERKTEHELLPRFVQNGLVGRSNALMEVVKLAQRAAKISDAPVIIYGESGTGKQRLAEIIHELDEKRRERPFICVNCAAITGTLAESELFGHKKGAFTGATEDRLGYFRAANGGTILLDEIGELDLTLQPKILRVSQEGLVLPVGSDREYRVDVRLIAATHRNLRKMILDGKFRLDLYQRLNVIQLNMPSLRERTEDIPALFESFLDKYAHYSRCRIESVDPKIYEILAWTVGAGNIRELENIVRQILIFKENGQRIEITDLPRDIIHKKMQEVAGQVAVDIPEEMIDAVAYGSKKLADVVDEYEKYMLSRLIDRGVTHTTLADSLGITRRTLYNKLQKHDLR